jgi:hypothetical protein
MTQKILVALDDSANAMRAVEQIAKICSPENQITKEFILGSISQKVLHSVKDKSVMIVG